MLSWKRFATAAIAVIGLGVPGLGANNNSHLILASASKGPSGFKGICKAYDWACSTGSGSLQDDESMMQLAIIINARVNAAVEPVTDAVQYGVAERWILPDTGRGDCEDFALLKKKLLIESGVPASRLLMVVAKSTLEKHAMLILRLNDGDYVLDNLTRKSSHGAIQLTPSLNCRIRQTRPAGKLWKQQNAEPELSRGKPG